MLWHAVKSANISHLCVTRFTCIFVNASNFTQKNRNFEELLIYTLIQTIEHYKWILSIYITKWPRYTQRKVCVFKGISIFITWRGIDWGNIVWPTFVWPQRTTISEHDYFRFRLVNCHASIITKLDVIILQLSFNSNFRTVCYIIREYILNREFDLLPKCLCVPQI